MYSSSLFMGYSYFSPLYSTTTITEFSSFSTNSFFCSTSIFDFFKTPASSSVCWSFVFSFQSTMIRCCSAAILNDFYAMKRKSGMVQRSPPSTRRSYSFPSERSLTLRSETSLRGSDSSLPIASLLNAKSERQTRFLAGGVSLQESGGKRDFFFPVISS